MWGKRTPVTWLDRMAGDCGVLPKTVARAFSVSRGHPSPRGDRVQPSSWLVASQKPFSRPRNLPLLINPQLGGGWNVSQEPFSSQ